MSRSVNKVILIGNLGKDPEQKFTPAGQSVAKFSLATSDRWKDKATGDAKESTEWHNVVCWAGLADVAAKYLTKGSTVYVEGRLQTRSWEKDGKKQYMTEVVASELVMLGGKAKDAAPSTGSETWTPPAGKRTDDLELNDSDLPF